MKEFRSGAKPILPRGGVLGGNAGSVIRGQGSVISVWTLCPHRSNSARFNGPERPLQGRQGRSDLPFFPTDVLSFTPPVGAWGNHL